MIFPLSYLFRKGENRFERLSNQIYILGFTSLPVLGRMPALGTFRLPVSDLMSMS
jgi:hypothetical protein